MVSGIVPGSQSPDNFSKKVSEDGKNAGKNLAGSAKEGYQSATGKSWDDMVAEEAEKLLHPETSFQVKV